LQSKKATSLHVEKIPDYEKVKEHNLKPSFLLIYKRLVFEDLFSRVTIDSHNNLCRIHKVSSNWDAFEFSDIKPTKITKVEYKYLEDKKNEDVYSLISELSEDYRTNLELIKDSYAL
jgi:hypothetical protein